MVLSGALAFGKMSDMGPSGVVVMLLVSALAVQTKYKIKPVFLVIAGAIAGVVGVV